MAEAEQKEDVKTELSDVEQQAAKMGWNPEWEGDKEGFIDAKEFIRRKPLFDRIESQKRQVDSQATQLKQVQDSLNQLAMHHRNVKEIEYQRALKDVKSQRREAMVEGDTAKALEFEDKIETLTNDRQEELQHQQRSQQVAAKNEPSAAFLAWSKDNSWYLENPDLNAEADGIAAAYVRNITKQGKQIVEKEVFDFVEARIKKNNPDLFDNPNRSRPSSVGSGERSSNTSGRKGSYRPTDEERQIAKNWVKQGIFKTEDEYYKERAAMKGDE